MINHVITWENGMVMVFDERGEPMPDYQGHKDDVMEKILQDAGSDVRFENLIWEEVRETLVCPCCGEKG